MKSCNFQTLISIVLMFCFVSLATEQKYPTHCKQVSSEHQICVMGCQPGWHGPFCNQRCHRQCNMSLCDQFDGRCTLGCSEGLLKQIISRRCSATTMKKKKRSSDVPANKCIQKDPNNEQRCTCCKETSRGDNCQILCKNCKTYSHNDICRYFCKGGYVGDYCNNTCPLNCKRGVYGDPLCDELHRGTIECSTGCAQGFYGLQCSNTCSKSCNNSVCYQRNGTCVDCLDMHYGDSCSSLCSNRCSRGRCHRVDGSCYVTCPVNCAPGGNNSPLCTDSNSDNVECSFGCIDGYHGFKCDKTCKDDCKICKQASGECLKCKDNLYGAMCDATCGCSGGLCHRNGTCKQCVSGFYGKFCTQICGSNCLHSNCVANTIDKNTYLCTNGCKNGFRGRQCNEDCPGNCAKCPQRSNNTVCVKTAEITSATEGNSVAVAVALTCILLAMVIFVIIVIWKRCRCSLGRRYNVREEAVDEEREYLRRHPEFRTSGEFERVKSFRRYQQYFRHIEAHDSRMQMTSNIPLTKPTSVKQKYRSWPGQLNRTGLNRSQHDSDLSKSTLKVPTVISQFPSSSKIDESRCTDFTKTWSMWKESNEGRKRHIIVMVGILAVFRLLIYRDRQLYENNYNYVRYNKTLLFYAVVDVFHTSLEVVCLSIRVCKRKIEDLYLDINRTGISSSPTEEEDNDAS